MAIIIKSESDAVAALRELEASESHGAASPDVEFVCWPVIEICTRENDGIAESHTCLVEGPMPSGTPTAIASLQPKIEMDLQRLGALIEKGEPDIRHLTHDVKRKICVLQYGAGNAYRFDLSAAFNTLGQLAQRATNKAKRLRGVVAASLAIATTAGVLAFASGVVELPEVTANVELNADAKVQISANGQVKATAAAELAGEARVAVMGTQTAFDFKLRGTIGPEHQAAARLLSMKSELPEVAYTIDRMQWWPDAWKLAPEKGHVSVNGAELSEERAKPLIASAGERARIGNWTTTVSAAPSVTGWQAVVTRDS